MEEFASSWSVSLGCIENPYVRTDGLFDSAVIPIPNGSQLDSGSEVVV
jgi:hypothetical protein